MRLTRAGVGICLVGLACFAIGRAFGTSELFLLAGMCAIAIMLAALYTLFARVEVAVERTATPTRLRAGAPARIDLEITNKARRSTPVLHLRDQVQNLTGASLMLAPIAKAASSHVAYRLPTRGRGELVVGPLDFSLGDPLGLTTSSLRASDQISLLVHPHVFDLGTLHAVAGNDPTAEQQPSRSLATGGDEFFALRPYVVGDELRRVNWRASARVGELVVKQEERARTGRVTVVLDTRRSSYDAAAFERAVSAALSVLHAAFRGRDALRFASSGASGFTDIRSRGELDAVDEQLALVATSDSASLVRTLDELAKAGRGGTIVVVTGTPTSELPAALEQTGRSFGTVIPIICGENTAGTEQADRLGTRIVNHDGEGDFAQRWADVRRKATASKR